ncbi:MAG: hypothetical protein ACXW3R_14660, partial [Rhodoplanes sp.]
MNIRILMGAVALFSATSLPALPRGDEPVAVPRTIRQGIDFVYVDPQMNSVARRQQRPQNWLQRLRNSDPAGVRSGRAAPNPLFVQMAQGLKQYQASWGQIPQHDIPTGPVLKSGSSGA